jgi:hypothetical protein
MILAGNLGGWGSRRTYSREGATPWRESTAPLLLPFFSLTAWICSFFFDSPYFFLLFLPAVILHYLLDRAHIIRSVFLEVLEVQLLYILGQGQLPGFLLRVGQAAELLRIQPQLSFPVSYSLPTDGCPPSFCLVRKLCNAGSFLANPRPSGGSLGVILRII